MPLYLLGVGGHFQHVVDCLESSSVPIEGAFDDKAQSTDRRDIPLMGSIDHAISTLDPTADTLHCCIGDGGIRESIVRRFEQAGFEHESHWPAFIHASAMVSAEAFIGRGSLICSGVVLSGLSRIGAFNIVNEGAVVCHHCSTGGFSHVAPNATLLGNVEVGEHVLVGGAAVVQPRVRLGNHSIVGSGSVVTRDINPSVTVCGNPARVLHLNELEPAESAEHTQWTPNKTRPIAEWSAKLLHNLAPSLASRQLSNGGPCVTLVENRLREVLCISNTHAVVAVANASLALSAIALAIDMRRRLTSRNLGPVAQYATQSFTFPSSVQGAFRDRTVVVDVDPSGELDLAAVPPDCEGLVVTHPFGYAGNVEQYRSWWLENATRVLIFDNAAAPFTRVGGRNTCMLGTASIVSLHHTKPIGFGEGGVAIVEADLEPLIRRAINFGYSKTVPLPWEAMATNMKMSELAAAACLVRLEEAQSLFEHGRRLLDLLRGLLAGSSFKVLLDEEATANHIDTVPAALCVLAPTVESAAELRIELRQKGFSVQQYYRPLQTDGCPNAVSIYNRILCFPCHEEISRLHVETIVRMLLDRPDVE